MSAAIYLLMLLMSGLAGFMFSRALHYRFLAEGFRIMQRQTEARGFDDASVDDLTASATDVSRAFGSLRIEVDS